MPIIRYSTEDEKCAPYKKFRYDAGWDLKSANEDFILKKGDKVEVNTGIKLAINRGFVGLIMPRSGMGTRYRVGLANTIGVIDADYRGDIKVYLVNDGHADIEIKKYDRICQLLIMPVSLFSMRRTPKLNETKRGDGGFGHTGIE